jgi:hypothetical protein
MGEALAVVAEELAEREDLVGQRRQRAGGRSSSQIRAVGVAAAQIPRHEPVAIDEVLQILRWRAALEAEQDTSQARG